MVENAKHVILANVEPQAMVWLKEPLIAASARGVEVRIKVYEAIEIPGVTVVLDKMVARSLTKPRMFSSTFVLMARKC